MTNEMGIQERRGSGGESRTEGLLLKRFFVMKRIPDVEGADYLVQLAADSFAELKQRRERIEAFAIVQSKFVEGANEVTIPTKYVLDGELPRRDFFLLVHSDDESEEDEWYFFTAEQINNEKDFFRRTDSKGKEVFVFARAAGRTYEVCRNLPKKQILDTIESGLSVTEKERNDRFVEQVLAETDAPSGYVEEAVSRLFHIPEPGNEARIPHGGTEYILRQDGDQIRVTQYSEFTQTTKTIGSFSGHLGEVSFDPWTETISTWPPTNRVDPKEA